MKSIYLPKEMELLVCSYGGVGTTFLIDFLAQYKICNNRDDKDGFKHLDKPPVPLEMSLDTYAAEGIDKFQFENHFLNWSERYSQYPVLFIRYEKIWGHLDELLEFAGIPIEEKRLFPDKKERKSEAMTIAEPVQSSMREMYGELQDRLFQGPDCWLHDKEKNFLDQISPLKYATKAKLGMWEVGLKRGILRLLGKK